MFSFLVNKNCLWPSRETNSHYTRPIISPSPTITFGATSFSTTNTSPFFTQSVTPTLFGQQQAQLWSRFRYAASTLRNDLWLEQTDSNLQQVPSNLFTSNYNTYSFDQSPMLLSPQTVPTKLMISTPLSSIEETPSSSLFRQRKNTSITDPIPSTKVVIRSSSPSKIFFTFAIFVIGLVLGCLLTNTLPPGLIWKTCIKYFQILFDYYQIV